MLFIGYLFGIRSERRLLEEIDVNVAYRQQIFDEIVRQAMDAGLVEGKVLYTDSTHLKAAARTA